MTKHRQAEIFIFILIIPLFFGCGNKQEQPSSAPLPVLLDMVHHPPGAPRYETKYDDPEVTAQLGYGGKVYMLFESAQLAVKWDSIDQDIIPKGSAAHAWVEQKAEEVHNKLRAAKDAGLQAFCQSDLILFPTGLIEKYGMQETFGQTNHPLTQKYLRMLINLMFQQFPELDGIVVRIGETYLDDAPYHQGRIDEKADADKTIIPLMNLLREEICVKLNKKLIFRTWMSFDHDGEKYLKISSAVAPHANLHISIKHCEGDFHRGQRFSRVLGTGRHKQIVEIECSLNAEGKGAYPNYIGDGLLNGFEEHQHTMRPKEINDLNELHQQSDLFDGIWTWSMASGWEGPYLENELWPDLNVYVLSQWARNPARSEEDIFHEFATEKLGLKGANISAFREICEVSGKAILRGKRSSRNYLSAWWSRDEYISFPSIPVEKDKIELILHDQDEAVALWEETVAIAGGLEMDDEVNREYIVVSCKYGLYLYRIYRAVVNLAVLGPEGDKEKIKLWVSEWDNTWAEWRTLKAEHPSCADIYQERTALRYMEHDDPVAAGLIIDRLRATLASGSNR